MAPQRTVVDHQVRSDRVELDSQHLRKPLLTTSCAFGRKIHRRRGALFTATARSATINHNNLETCELLPLILGTARDGFESEFLLRARRGNEAAAGASHSSRAARGPAIYSPRSTRFLPCCIKPSPT
jgi:hypothetical protein